MEMKNFIDTLWNFKGTRVMVVGAHDKNDPSDAIPAYLYHIDEKAHVAYIGLNEDTTERVPLETIMPPDYNPGLRLSNVNTEGGATNEVE